ncbi:YodC family protein [Rhizobium sp. GN54]|uniref:YodC family protein n=1 Tax=Rhizobium sp. GN54 TaxID=2898150 RepID=UPI001E5DBF8E|nr:DUF2158 domain-containing protein [Rhizobium sp. GN54]MCD2181050.1 DUF2158 domain-containing protein [Rhizobium sp. GN54]
MKFSVGDVVVLKSGGPPMTIRHIEDDVAYCEWFHDGESKGHKFATAQLELVDA